jgi:hypothetical protein
MPTRTARSHRSFEPARSTITAVGGALPELIVTFVDSARPVPREGLVFGRGAELDIDSNPFLHRSVGRFVADDGHWWIENLGAWTTLRVASDGLAVQLPSGGRAALISTESVVTFGAGACNYELRAALDRVPEPVAAPTDLGCSTATYEPIDVPLTVEQRLLVVALAEQRLRRPDGRHGLPSNRELARRLGWSDAKFNRKLDHLCHRLDRIGVAGMRLEGRRANDRRHHLVDHMLAGGLITAADLAMLDRYPAGSEERDR